MVQHNTSESCSVRKPDQLLCIYEEMMILNFLGTEISSFVCVASTPNHSSWHDIIQSYLNFFFCWRCHVSLFCWLCIFDLRLNGCEKQGAHTTCKTSIPFYVWRVWCLSAWLYGCHSKNKMPSHPHALFECSDALMLCPTIEKIWIFKQYS